MFVGVDEKGLTELALPKVGWDEVAAVLEVNGKIELDVAPLEAPNTGVLFVPAEDEDALKLNVAGVEELKVEPKGLFWADQLDPKMLGVVTLLAGVEFASDMEAEFNPKVGAELNGFAEETDVPNEPLEGKLGFPVDPKADDVADEPN